MSSQELIRTYTYPLLPNRTQEQTLLEWIERCRRLYNAALEQRKYAYRTRQESVTQYAQQRQLAELRQSESEWESVPSDVLRSALRRLDHSFQAFFRRVENGESPGYPRFKEQGRYASFDFPLPTVKGNRVRIPILGLVKFNLYRRIPDHAKIREARVRLTKSRRWVLSLVLDFGDAPAKRHPKSSTGIDVGLSHFLTLSNGEHTSSPKFYRAEEQHLSTLLKMMFRAQKSSNNRFRLKVRLARLHEHIKNLRLNHARQLAKALVTQYDLVAYEDLNIQGMVQNSRLSKSINDAGWSIFLGCLRNKAEEAGTWAVAVEPRGTSIECSECGERVPKLLSERIHHCDHCGLILDRDQNAALNIEARGLRVLETLMSKVDERIAS